MKEKLRLVVGFLYVTTSAFRLVCQEQAEWVCTWQSDTWSQWTVPNRKPLSSAVSGMTQLTRSGAGLKTNIEDGD